MTVQSQARDLPPDCVPLSVQPRHRAHTRPGPHKEATHCQLQTTLEKPNIQTRTINTLFSLLLISRFSCTLLIPGKQAGQRESNHRQYLQSIDPASLSPTQRQGPSKLSSPGTSGGHTSSQRRSHLNAPFIRSRQQQHLEQQFPALEAESEGNHWTADSDEERQKEWDGEG